MTPLVRAGVVATAIAIFLAIPPANAAFFQQGPSLVGSGAAGGFQGWSVALSADGSTAIVGSRQDNVGNGAAWVFTRTGGVWSQQGSKLVGTGAVRGMFGALQGRSAALSAD